MLNDRTQPANIDAGGTGKPPRGGPASLPAAAA